MVQGVLGTFDSLNPFIVKGLPPLGVMRAPLVGLAVPITGYVVESLMARSYDEPFTLYGLLARTVETDAARSFVTFDLDPRARFSDGKPVTPEDVLFSWQLLRDKGRPNHRIYYSKVVKAEAVPPNAVRFDLSSGDDRELPLILGLMPILPKHADRSRDVRGYLVQGDDRQRPLCHRQGRSRPESHAHPRPELLGTRSCDQPRVLEFRRGQIRFLSRPEHPSRSVQARPVRRPQGNRPGALAAGLRLPRLARRTCRQGKL